MFLDNKCSRWNRGRVDIEGRGSKLDALVWNANSVGLNYVYTFVATPVIFERRVQDLPFILCIMLCGQLFLTATLASLVAIPLISPCESTT